ncbi:hypothetical protein WJ978_25350 [Achromobacter xylosoxidans]
MAGAAADVAAGASAGAAAAAARAAARARDAQAGPAGRDQRQRQREQVQANVEPRGQRARFLPPDDDGQPDPTEDQGQQQAGLRKRVMWVRSGGRLFE